MCLANIVLTSQPKQQGGKQDEHGSSTFCDGVWMNKDRLKDFMILSSEKNLSDYIDLDGFVKDYSEVPQTRCLIKV